MILILQKILENNSKHRFTKLSFTKYQRKDKNTNKIITLSNSTSPLKNYKTYIFKPVSLYQIWKNSPNLFTFIYNPLSASTNHSESKTKSTLSNKTLKLTSLMSSFNSKNKLNNRKKRFKNN